MSGKNKVVGCELKGSEQIRCNHSRQIMQGHSVMLLLLYYFAEELDYKDEYVPVDLRQHAAYLLESVKLDLLILDILQIPEPAVQIICAQGLAHMFKDLLQEICGHMGLCCELG